MSAESDRRKLMLQELGIGPVWRRRDGLSDSAKVTAQSAKLPEEQFSQAGMEAYTNEAKAQLMDDTVTSSNQPVPLTAPSNDEIARMDWRQLQEHVAGCVRCDLCKSRTKAVFGTGDEKANWLFVGEGPGRNEDLRGEPFIGPAGKLLDNMMLAMQLRRGENAYIANIVKCRPAAADGKDRPPTAEEAAACLPYLERQIALIQPTVIVALGKTAGLSLLGLDPDTPVSKLRGKVHQYQGIPLIVTYHPAYLLRKLTEKGKVWGDLCMAMDAYAAASR